MKPAPAIRPDIPGLRGNLIRGLFSIEMDERAKEAVREAAARERKRLEIEWDRAMERKAT